MLGLGRFGGKIAALPFAVSTPILYYNSDLFPKAGLDPRKPPETWAELEQAAQRLTKPSTGSGSTGTSQGTGSSKRWCRAPAATWWRRTKSG